MVRIKFILLFLIAVCFTACADMKVSYDYPNNPQMNKSYNFNAAKHEVASVSSSSGKDEHEGHDQNEYPWPIKDAPKLLKETELKKIITAYNQQGEEVLFAVAEEYPSAGKKLCKKYYVNLELHLACFNPHWYPVRSFEE